MLNMGNREEWVGVKPGSPPPGSGFGRLDFYVAAFLTGFGIVIATVLIVVLWPWKELVAIGLSLIGLSVGGLQLYKGWEHHRADIAAKQNRAMIVHEGPSGFGYVHQGRVQTHTLGGSTPFAPTVPMLPQGWEGNQPEPEEPEYPREFNELMRASLIAPGSDFVLAFTEDGEPVKMDKLTALGIAGMPGFGKTVSTLVMLMEAIVKYNGKIKFIIADPHMYVDGDESLASKIAPLRTFFLTIDDIRGTVPDEDRDYHSLLNRLDTLPNPSVGGTELAGWMALLHTEMDRRLQGKKGETWVVVIDEFVAVMDDKATAKPVSSMLKKIQQQARKMNMFSLLISQDWKASAAGGTDVRQSIPTFIIHNTAQSIAELIVPADKASQAPTLDIGQVLVHTRGKTKVARVPYATAEDAETLAELYGPRRFYAEVKEVHQEVSQPAEYAQLPSPAVQLPEDWRMDEVQAVGVAFLSGLGETDIAKKVYGAKSGPELAENKIRVRGQLAWMINNGALRGGGQ